MLWNGENGFEVKHINGRGRQYTVDLVKRTCSYVRRKLKITFILATLLRCSKKYEPCLQPIEGEEMWHVSANPRPEAPEYVRMPGRSKKHDRKREDVEAPKGKQMSKHGTIIKMLYVWKS